MSQNNIIRINTAALVFAIGSSIGMAVTWGTILSELRALQGVPARVIIQEERTTNLERRVGTLERKGGLAGSTAGEPLLIDGVER